VNRGVISRVPEIHPVSDLARRARELIQRARERQEPIVITQRGRHAAVLVPIEVYRNMERMLLPLVASPRLAHPEDAERFRMELTVVTEPKR
jgi:prevent-host-death family protein